MILCNKQDKHVLIPVYYTLGRVSLQIPCISSDFLPTIFFFFFHFHLNCSSLLARIQGFKKSLKIPKE